MLERALQATGGRAAWQQVRALQITGTLAQYDPEQSFQPGGEPKHVNDAEFSVAADVASRSTRTDWTKRFKYPFVVTRQFSEIVTPRSGYVLGIDTIERNRQSLQTDPPAHAMSGLRLATTQRELLRTSPLLLLRMHDEADRVRALPDITVGGTPQAALEYRADEAVYTVLFDRASGLPTRVRTLDHDNIWGDVDCDVVLEDWRSTGAGLRYPARQRYELSGRLMQHTTITALRTEAVPAAGAFTPPDAVLSGAAAPATGRLHHQWVMRRQFIGTYLDSDGLSFDDRAPQGLRLVALAPGVQQVVGGSHNVLLVELRDRLVLFDAPVNDGFSAWVIAAARAQYPAKPIRHVVLTHHHMDHAGGLRAFVAQGAELVVGQGQGAHFRRVLAAPFTRNPDLAPSDLGGARVVEVSGRHVIGDGEREAVALLLEGNPHAVGLMIGYVPQARIGWVTDLWAPGRPLPPAMNPLLQALIDGVDRAGIEPLRFAGAHGSVAPYAALRSFAAR